MDPAPPPDAGSTALADTPALAGLEARLDWLRATTEAQRERLRVAEESMAKEAQEFRDRSAALRTERTAIRGRLEDFLAENPRLPHLIPLRQGFALHSGCAALGERLAADAYIAHDDIPLLAADMLGRRLGGSVVYDAAEFPERSGRFGQYQLLWPRSAIDLFTTFTSPLIRSCAFSLAGGEPIAEHIRETFGIPSYTILNARSAVFGHVDTTIRAQCGAGPADILMLYVNTVSRASLFENLVEGLAGLDERHHLAVLGKLSPRGESLEQELTALARQQGVLHRLHFLGVVPHDEMPRFASGADVAIVAADPRIPNCRMAVHNRYFDALAAGLPVLGSENLGARHAFGREPFYHEFDLLDPAGFVSSVSAVDWKRFDRDAVRTWARGHTWEREADKVVEHFAGMSSVTILAVKDVAEHLRTLGVARALGEAGIRVNIVCRRLAEAVPDVPNAEWFRLEAFG